LAAGLISPKECLAVLEEAHSGVLGPTRDGPKVWLSEILWRDFYRHVMLEFPHVVKGLPFRPEGDLVPWQEPGAEFDAWCEGRTGVPIVDAAMRCLVSEGWLHNRLRMVVAMYLTKDLLIDWRLGERFFNRHLVDADFASNNGGWQWSASTGTDAAPYFRVFNPVLQSKKTDPDGAFIRRWVPELRDVEGDAVHQPSPFDRELCGYPAEIVDHRMARARAIEAYGRALK
jgi:deoxyribodipyrimidine photo-lyase